MLFDSFNQARNAIAPKTIAALAFFAASCTALSPFANAQDKEAPKFSADQKAQVLNYRPNERLGQDLDYDFKFEGRPPADVLEKSQMQKADVLLPGKSGYVLADATNRVVRVLIDSNNDRTLDFFSYYKDGIEVYRETDTDYNSQANEYRWFGNAGTRWGIDRNQDGEIDEWKVISAEEVAYEVFMAIRNRDDARYQRLLLTNEEFQSLGLKGNVAKDAAARLEKARKEFGTMVRSQKTIDGKSKWINSGNGQPSLAAAGPGLGKDLICHDHASSVFESASGTDTLALGTLVKVGDIWRLMELPQVVPRGKAIENGGVLFPVVQIVPTVGETRDLQSEKLAKLYEKLTEQEAAIGKVGKPGVQMANLQKDRAMLQWDIYKEIKDKKEKLNWLENIGDTVSNAYQAGNYPEGLKFLESVIKTLRDNKRIEALDYVRWRMIHAEYMKRLDDGDNRQDEETSDWYHEEQLKKFASEFPESKFTPDGLFSIGQHFEVSRKRDLEKAKQWYKTCAQAYGSTPFGKRAAGALIRLNGRGKPVPFEGKTVDGKVFNIQNKVLRDRAVVVFYWQLWCASQSVNAKGDTAFEVFQDLKSKYKDELVIVSANIESPVTSARYKDFDGEMKGLFEMHAPGGMEGSPLAIQLGVVSEPTVVVWDKEGNMYDAESGVGDLERIIQRILKDQ